MQNKPKVGLISLGCPKNQVDAEVMLHHIQQAGYPIETDESQCDVIIVNTCGFIESAKKEAIDTILDVADYKEEGHLKSLIVSGCLSQRYPNTLLEEIPEIDAVIGVTQYPDIVDYIEQSLGRQRVHETELDLSVVGCAQRIITTPSHLAYLKIAEGCDNCCAYCAIPSIRGGYRSKSFDAIIDEAKGLIDGGAKEITLIAQDTTRYGMDLADPRGLSDLLDTMAKLDSSVWIRALYLYPEIVDQRLIDTILSHDNLCNYMDIPLQHINDTMLKKMNRRSDRGDIVRMYNMIKSSGDIALRTTFITGFPGETQEAFEELRTFIQDYLFDHMGVFDFSPEEGTAAFKMLNTIPKETAIQRRDELMELQMGISRERLKNRIGTREKVLLEGIEDGLFYGRGDFQAYEIDGKVYIANSDLEGINLGEFYDVKLTNATDYDLEGNITK